MKHAPSLAKISTLVVLVCVLLTPAVAIDFDTTFASSGKFMTTYSGSGNPSSSGSRIYIQPSGRIVVVGNHQQQGVAGRVNGIGLAGLTSGGILDTGFGSGGKVLLWDETGTRSLTDVTMLDNGSLLVFYRLVQAPKTDKPVLVRYTADGQFDGEFAANIELSVNQTRPVIVALGTGGKIYVTVRVGSAYSLIRLNDNGSRDTTFGPNGVRDLDLQRFSSSPTIFGINELPGGKLLVTGHYENADFERVSFVTRFDNDTNIDRSFGLQGATRIAIPYGNAYGTRTVIQPDGKILFVGFNTFLGSHAMLVRLTARGRFDSSFGTNGIVLTSFNNVNVIHGVGIAPDGKIVVTGTSSEKAFPPNERLFVARFSAGGVRESFLVTNFLANRDAGGADLKLQSDGKILITGFTQNPAPDNFLQMGVARFVP